MRIISFYSSKDVRGLYGANKRLTRLARTTLYTNIVFWDPSSDEKILFLLERPDLHDLIQTVEVCVYDYSVHSVLSLLLPQLPDLREL